MPTFPLADLSSHAGQRALQAACKDWGFFQVVNHGVPAALRAQFLQASADFFALPATEKQQIRRTEANPWGFFDAELTKNRPDWKEIFDFGIDQAGGTYESHSQWPTGLPGFRAILLEWFDCCCRLSLLLLERLAESLGAPAGTLHQHFTPEHTSFLRLNYYPECENPASALEDMPTHGHLGISPHTDAGALTVLVQDDVAALQVRHEGAWHTVSPEADALIINLGDLMEVWSNGLYRAPEHRVLANTSVTRYSAPFFLNPNFSCDVAPLSSEPRKYRTLNWGKYRAGRAAGDYANIGAEVQVSDYRL